MQRFAFMRTAAAAAAAARPLVASGVTFFFVFVTTRASKFLVLVSTVDPVQVC